jgi:hypothetical protein
VTADFDPEHYLRQAGQRALADPEFARIRTRRRWGSEVFETGAALVAAGRLPAAVAQEFVRDYETRLRDPRWGGHVQPSATLEVEQRTSRAGLSLSGPRVVTVERDLVRSWGSLRVHYVVLGNVSTSAVVSTTVSKPQLNDRKHRLGGFARNPNWVHEWLTLTDDQGSSQKLEIWGGVPQRYTTRGPLSRPTRWIDVDSDRVNLAQPTPMVLGDVERLPSVDPAVDHLWRRLATYFCFFPLAGPLPLLDVGIDALIAAGALRTDSPAINEVRAVAMAFTGHPVTTTELPVPWASLLSRWSREDGSTGAVGLSLAVPRIGDASICMEGLVSGASEFRVYLTVSPAWQLTGAPFIGLEAVAPLSWWAEDDVGNYYLGTVSDGRHAAHGDRADGSIRFWPGLDPRASELRILTATKTHRAVCPVTLPRWPAARP